MSLTGNLPALWQRARVRPSGLPTAGVPALRRLCREPRSRPESQPRRTPCILPERKSHGGTSDGAAGPQAQAEPAPPHAAPDSTARDLAADSFASPKSSFRHSENALLPRSRRSGRVRARRIYSQPFFWPPRGKPKSPFHILRSRRAAHRHRPCAMPPGQRLAPSPARRRNPDRQTSVNQAKLSNTE